MTHIDNLRSIRRHGLDHNRGDPKLNIDGGPGLFWAGNHLFGSCAVAQNWARRREGRVVLVVRLLQGQRLVGEAGDAFSGMSMGGDTYITPDVVPPEDIEEVK